MDLRIISQRLRWITTVTHFLTKFTAQLGNVSNKPVILGKQPGFYIKLMRVAKRCNDIHFKESRGASSSKRSRSDSDPDLFMDSDSEPSQESKPDPKPDPKPDQSAESSSHDTQPPVKQARLEDKPVLAESNQFKLTDKNTIKNSNNISDPKTFETMM